MISECKILVFLHFSSLCMLFMWLELMIFRRLDSTRPCIFLRKSLSWLHCIFNRNDMPNKEDPENLSSTLRCYYHNAMWINSLWRSIHCSYIPAFTLVVFTKNIDWLWKLGLVKTKLYKNAPSERISSQCTELCMNNTVRKIVLKL